MSVTLPNWITIARLALSIVFFALLANYDAARHDEARPLLLAAFWVFLAAAISDYIDGYLARRLGQVTPFGRVMDPFADKVLICGAFISFAGSNFQTAAGNPTHVAPWMAILILGRELFVTAVRTHSETSGKPFGALWSGKIKMLVQSIAAGVILGVLALEMHALKPLIVPMVWITVVVTALSVINYLGVSKSFLQETGTLDHSGQRAAPREQSRPDPAQPYARSSPAASQESAP